MIDAAKAEADQIIKDAEKVAFDEVKKKNDQAQQTKQEAEHEAERIRNEAENEAERVVNEAESKSRKIEEEARDRGFAQGREDGYAKGEQEVERLVDRMHVILNKTIDRRNEIIEESEAQLVQLVLQIAKKVVKVISENQKNIVINNVVQSLRKLRAKADVVIRVNVQDLKLTTDHVKRFMEIAEKAEHITVMEDSTVDRGGCIIETDFGQIDARISSQLREIEEKILELVPIKTKARPKDSS
jgi:flagellar assembly protein FliH